MGCMRMKHSVPRCEHCGYDETSQNSIIQLPVGTVLAGQYVVGRVLGQGGFGVTYMGYDQNLGLRCAIKEYYPSYMATRTRQSTVQHNGFGDLREYRAGLERFVREARMLAELQDVPGIARVHNLFQANGTAYIVMEFVEGVTLTKYIAQNGGKLDVQTTMNVLNAVMDTLEQVHEGGLVHRDISPDNIMLQKNGRVRLLDFGTAKKVEGDETHQTTIVRHGFAPYEQYETHGNVGPWTDVYALCATAFYAMTGRLPVPSVMRRAEGTAIDWDSIDGLTEHQKQALQKGTEVLASQRYVGIPEFRQALAPEPVKRDSRKTYVMKRKTTRSHGNPPKVPLWRKWLPVVTLLVLVAGALMFPLMKLGRNTLRADPNTKAYSDDVETMSVFGNENLQRKMIASITFLDTLENVPIDHWDVSEEQNRSVLAWTEPTGTNKNGLAMYHLYLAAEGGMYAPESCKQLFRGYANAEQIQFNDAFYTENVTDMSYMFFGCTNLTTLDVSKFDTSGVINMIYMFGSCVNLEAQNFDNWDFSGVRYYQSFITTSNVYPNGDWHELFE